MKFCDKRLQNHLLNGGKIKRRDFDVEVGLNKVKRLSCDCSGYYILTQYDLTVDDWEIVEPEYNWDKIIKDKVLCEFWDDEKDTDDPCVGLLAKRTTIGFYRTNGCCLWKNCKPFNPAEYNIAKDLKEYEK